MITEDSDLLAYGCPEVVFKLSRGGDCDHIRIADLPMNRTLSFSGLNHDNFVEVGPSSIKMCGRKAGLMIDSQ